MAELDVHGLPGAQLQDGGVPYWVGHLLERST